MNTPAVKKPPPKIGQLKTGEWVIFNMQGTPFWEMDAIFETQQEAEKALVWWNTQQGDAK